MFASMLALMLAATPGVPKNFRLPPAPKCKGECAERYRLPLASDDTPDVKSRALALDGSKCDVVGAERCLSKRRVIFRSTEDPMDTLSASLAPQ